MTRCLLPLLLLCTVVTGCGAQTLDERSVAQEEDDTEFSVFGDQVGNGGHIFVCSNADEPSHMELLDFFESRVIHGRGVTLAGYDTKTMVEDALSPLEALDPARFSRYKQSVDLFFSETKFVEQKLVSTQDTFHNIEPNADCELQQFAVQRQPPNSLSPRYLIHLPYWRETSLETRAGLILHEVVYRHAIARGHRDSRAVRLFTGMLAAHFFDNIRDEEYQQIVQNLRL